MEWMKTLKATGGGKNRLIVTAMVALAALLLPCKTFAKPYLYVKGDYNTVIWSWGTGDYADYHLYGDGTLHTGGEAGDAVNALMERVCLNSDNSWWYRVDLSHWRSEYGELTVSFRHYKNGYYACPEGQTITISDFTQNTYAEYTQPGKEDTSSKGDGNASTIKAPTEDEGDAAFTARMCGQIYLLSNITATPCWSVLQGGADYEYPDNCKFEYSDGTTWKIELTPTNVGSGNYWRFRLKEAGNDYMMCPSNAEVDKGDNAMGNGVTKSVDSHDDTSGGEDLTFENGWKNVYKMIGNDDGSGGTYFADYENPTETELTSTKVLTALANARNTWTIPYDPNVTKIAIYLKRRVGGGDGTQTNPEVTVLLTYNTSTEGKWYYMQIMDYNTGTVKATYPLERIRNRQGGSYVTSQLTVNLKYDEIRKDIGNTDYSQSPKAKYRIVYGQWAGGNNFTGSYTIYQMWPGSVTENFELGYNYSQIIRVHTKSAEKNKNMKNFPGIETGTYGNCYTYSNGGPFFITLPKEKGGSVTWHYNVSSHDLTIYKHPRLDYLHKSSGYVQLMEDNYYLIGNLRNVSPTNSNWDPDLSRPMQKVVYPLNWNGDVSKIDSIVYTQTILRPTTGYGNLYIGVAPGSVFDEGWDGSSNWLAWDHILRPFVQSNYDAISLNGGIFSWGDDKNQEQALNPVIEDGTVESYTFSINLTTATYRMIKNESLYIMGPAIARAGSTGTGPGENDGWYANTNNGDNEDHVFKLTLDTKNQCYVYAATDGSGNVLTDGDGCPIPAKLHFYKGKKFRFATNKRFDKTNYAEDHTIPADLSETSKDYFKAYDHEEYPEATENTYVENDPVMFVETQYLNKVTPYINSAVAHGDLESDEKEKDIEFDLPSGDYTIRLYNKVRIGDDGYAQKAEIYYALDREFVMKKASSVAGTAEFNNALGCDNYRAFSDWHAFKTPENVRVFIVTDTDHSHMKLTAKEITSLGYIPAQTGVILGTNGTDAANRKPTFVHYDNPNKRLEGETNYLRPAIYNQVIEEKPEGGGVNFVLSCKKLTVGADKPSLGYFRSDGGESGRNNSYLYVSDATVDAKAFAFSWLFGDDDPIVTALNAATVAAPDPSAPVYNLSGQRVGTQYKGVVIQNGKKYFNR